MGLGFINTALGALVLGSASGAWFFLGRHNKMQSSRTEDDTGVTISLLRSPNELSRFDIVTLFVAAIFKHVGGIFGRYRPRRDENSTQQFALPEIRVKGLLRISDEAERLFMHSIVHPSEPDIKARQFVNPLFLPALTSPLVIRILVDRASPVKPLGCVNTHNTLKYHDGRLCRNIKTLTFLSQAGRLSYSAVFGGQQHPGYRRKRGMEFCIEISIFCDGSPHPVLTQELWYLQFMHPSVQPRYAPTALDPKQDDVALGEVLADQTLRMDKQDPQRWAKSCKDYNPIHVSTIGARLFGFRSVIAHGNHTAALAIHLFLQNRDACAKSVVMELFDPFILKLRFERPLILPAEADVRWHGLGLHEKTSFSVSRNDKACVTGSFELDWE